MYIETICILEPFLFYFLFPPWLKSDRTFPDVTKIEENRPCLYCLFGMRGNHSGMKNIICPLQEE